MVTGGVYKVLHKKGTFVSKLRLTILSLGTILSEIHSVIPRQPQVRTTHWGVQGE